MHWEKIPRAVPTWLIGWYGTRTPSGWEYQEYGHKDSFPLTSLDITIPVSTLYRRLSIPLEKRTLMPLEVIEPADEQEET